MQSYEKIIRWPFSLRFWETGRVYARGQVLNGLRQGVWTFLFRSGARQMEGGYEGGVKQGQWTKWWPNGNPASQGEFIDGRMHGLWTDWFPSGEKAQESRWDHGRRTGKAAVFDKDSGKVIKTHEYDVSQEPVTDYTLMTDRDVAFAMATAQKQRLTLAWQVFVGAKVARYLEPWHGALWLMLFVLTYGLTSTRLGLWAIPAAFVGTTLACLGAMWASVTHSMNTRPDYGVKKT